MADLLVRAARPRADRLGWCDRCALAWNSRRLCHCVACHRSFSGESTFTAHQRLDRSGGVSCDPRGLRECPSGDGTIWRSAEEYPSELRGTAPEAPQGARPAPGAGQPVSGPSGASQAVAR